MAAAQKTMNGIAAQLVSNAKAEVSSSSNPDSVEKSDIAGRDLLTLLVKANMATDTKDAQKMVDKDVLARRFSSLSA
jgi:hypothetical protein